MLLVKLVAVSVLALIPATAELSTITSAKILELTNAERRKAGVAQLTSNSLLHAAAAQKAQDMLDKDYFAHISPQGITPWFWMAKVGYSYELAGENLAIDFTEAEDVVAAWLASPTHKENMLLPDYTETGIAAASGEFQGGTSIVVVHMFGRGVGQVAAKQTSPTPAATPPPTPPPVPVDTTPPRAPRIAVAAGSTIVKNSVDVALEGEPGTAVRILVNNQVQRSVLLPGNGKSVESLDLSALPQGTLVVRAYAVDGVGNTSAVSDGLALTKDTVGPLIDEKALAFALAPAFDGAQVAVRTDGWRVIGAAIEPLSLTFADEFGNETTLPNLSFTPQFLTDTAQDELTLPSNVQQFSRRLGAVTAVVLAGLLLATIFIRIRVQRPALIAHASLVILVAIGLFLI